MRDWRVYSVNQQICREPPRNGSIGNLGCKTTCKHINAYIAPLFQTWPTLSDISLPGKQRLQRELMETSEKSIDPSAECI